MLARHRHPILSFLHDANISLDFRLFCCCCCYNAPRDTNFDQGLPRYFQRLVQLCTKNVYVGTAANFTRSRPPTRRRAQAYLHAFFFSFKENRAAAKIHFKAGYWHWNRVDQFCDDRARVESVKCSEKTMKVLRKKVKKKKKLLHAIKEECVWYGEEREIERRKSTNSTCSTSKWVIPRHRAAIRASYTREFINTTTSTKTTQQMDERGERGGERREKCRAREEKVIPRKHGARSSQRKKKQRRK